MKKMKELKPNDQRAKSAIALIWIVLVLEIVNLISSYMQYDLLQTIVNGGFVSEEVAEANDMRESVLGLIYFVVHIISAIVFIMWFRRAYFNLHQKVNTLAYSEGWAAGGWFVPIISLYRPYQIMKEIYIETKKLFIKNGISERVEYSTSNLGWWWTLWIISAFVGQFVFRFALKSADTIDNLMIITVSQMALSVLGVPLALITSKIIKDYSKVEPLLAEISNDELEINHENVLE